MLNKRFFKTKDEVEVTFEFSHKPAETVALVGEFNNWQPVEMKKIKKTGAFKTKLRLPKNSQFQFRYLVNGSEWENDDAADAYWQNEHGTDNSVVDTHQA
jgi:1,4-alpha-glucan branching enzyme